MIFPFQGLMAPVITPFAEDSAQSLNLDVIPGYAKYLVDVQKITGVLVNGTGGEGMSMTMEERNAATEAWVAASKPNGITVMVQVGGACLKDVQAMAAHSEKLGVAGLLCLPDLFNKPATEEDLVSYLQHVGAAAPNTPLLYYHMPAFTNVNLDLAKIFELAVVKVPTFAGSKFTNTNLEEGGRALAIAERHKLSVFLGFDSIMAGGVALGFDSAIAITLNMDAGPSHNILSSLAAGHVTEALANQKRLNERINAIIRYASPGLGGRVAAMKEAMNAMTPIKVGKPRPPLHPLTDAQFEQLKKELKLLKA